MNNTDFDMEIPEDDLMNKKKRKNSKKKGNRFELQVANELSEMFNDVFRRTPSSGAFTGGINRFKYSGINNQAQNTLTGDTIVPDWFDMALEMKNYSDHPRVDNFLTNDGDIQMDKWIDQAKKDAEYIGKKWLLIMNNTNLRRSFICMDFSAFDDMCNKNSLNKPESYTVYKNKYIIIDKKLFFYSYLINFYKQFIKTKTI